VENRPLKPLKSQGKVDLMPKKYQIIYADPPWNSNSQFGRDKNKGNEQHYPLMDLEAIKNLPIKELADENCILFLWVVDTQLFDAEKVINAWGFTYKTVGFTWVKQTTTGKDHFGVGMWTRKNPEMCLLATKGHPKRINAGIRQLQKQLVREHSQKPDIIKDEIVKLVGDLPRIELFARQKTEGWDVWGNEVESDIQLNA
jgi:N6-adenosine-specific RNA methylase IME4